MPENATPAMRTARATGMARGSVARAATLAVAIAALSACSEVGTYGNGDVSSEKSGERSAKKDTPRKDSSGSDTERKPDGKIEQKAPQHEEVPDEKVPDEEDDPPTSPPVNITGIYLTCSPPYGVKADTVAFDCRMERDGKKLDDDGLVSSVTWKFKSPNAELAQPRIDLNPSADWHAAYVFVGRAALSSEDLRDSTVLVELAASSSDTSEISVTYREDCKSHKPDSASCTVNTAPAVGIPRRTSWLNQGDHILLSWAAPTVPAVGTLVVKSQAGGSMAFRPVDGQRYTTGTLYGSDVVAYVGPEISLQDRKVVSGSEYTYAFFHHDESFVYSPGMVMGFVSPISGSEAASP